MAVTTNDLLSLLGWGGLYRVGPVPDGALDSFDDRLQILGHLRSGFGAGGLVHLPDPEDLDQSNADDDLYERYGIDNRHRCYRIGVRKENALGIAELGGERWLHPELGSEAISVFDAARRKFDVMYDEDTGLPFMLMTKDGPTGSGVSKLYVDSYVNQQDTGVEISWLLRFKEFIGQAEHMLLKFAEFHAFMRPQDEKNKNATGHTKFGYRNAQAVTLNVYKNGNLILDARTHGFPEKGDLTFDEQIAANRIQMELAGTASELRITGAKSYYEQLDQRGAPDQRIMEEGEFQEMLSLPLFWVTRGRSPLKDRVTGNEGVGSGYTMVEGPDGDSESAMLTDGTGMVWDEAYALAGDFSLMFGVKGASLDQSLFTFGNGDTIELVTVGTEYLLRFSSGGNDADVAVDWDGLDWGMFMVQRVGQSWKVCFNHAICGTVAIPPVEDLSGAIAITAGDPVTIFDIRVYPGTLDQAAWDYYLTSVISYQGAARNQAPRAT